MYISTYNCQITGNRAKFPFARNGEIFYVIPFLERLNNSFFLVYIGARTSDLFDRIKRSNIIHQLEKNRDSVILPHGMGQYLEDRVLYKGIGEYFEMWRPDEFEIYHELWDSMDITYPPIIIKKQ